MSERLSTDSPGNAELRARLGLAEQYLREEGHHALSSELTLGLLHKLNNLMTGVYFNLEIAETSLDAQHPASGVLREIAAAVQQAQTLVRQTADLNLAPDPEVSYFEIGTLIEENWELMKIVLPKSTSSTFTKHSEPLYVKISSEEFREALLQLVSTTRAAFVSGESHVSVQARPVAGLDLSGFHPSLQEVEGGVAVLYRDDVGEPVEPADLHPFQAFGRERGDVVGTRLFRARELIRKQGGFLAVRTVPGGVEFVIILPGVS